ncbi:MAG: hypothetical protein QOG87_1350 [Actinomycetota bacterium]
MKVHVTGGSGFLGSHVIPLLCSRGHQVTALARSATAADRVNALGAAPISGDLDDPASLDAAFRASDAEVLVNVASLGFGHATTIVAAAEDAGIGRAVFVSTTAIFTNLNAGSKAVRQAAEKAITGSELAWTIIRPTMIYGTPADRNIARLLQLLRRSPVVPLPGGGRRLQQPVHVDDVAMAVVAAAETDRARGQAYDVAGPEPLTFRALIEAAAAAVGRAPRLVPVPLRPLIGAVRVYERMASRPRIKAEQLERLAEDKAFDIGPARADFGYAPRSFAEGVAQEVALL